MVQLRIHKKEVRLLSSATGISAPLSSQNPSTSFSVEVPKISDEGDDFLVRDAPKDQNLTSALQSAAVSVQRSVRESKGLMLSHSEQIFIPPSLFTERFDPRRFAGGRQLLTIQLEVNGLIDPEVRTSNLHTSACVMTTPSHLTSQQTIPTLVVIQGNSFLLAGEFKRVSQRKYSGCVVDGWEAVDDSTLRILISAPLPSSQVPLSPPKSQKQSSISMKQDIPVDNRDLKPYLPVLSQKLQPQPLQSRPESAASARPAPPQVPPGMNKSVGGPSNQQSFAWIKEGLMAASKLLKLDPVGFSTSRLPYL